MSAAKPSTLEKIFTWPPSPGRSLLGWWSVTIIAVVGAAMVGFGVSEILSGGGQATQAFSNLHILGWVLAVACGVGALFALRRLRGMSRQMEESEQRFRVIADATPAMVWTSRPDGQCDYCNRAWYEFMGDAAQGTLGERWTAAIHPDDFEACRDAYMSAVGEHRDYRWEFRLRRHDGVYHWVLSFGAPRQAPDGSFGGYVGMCVDISEQREMKRQADEALARFDHAAAASAHGVFEWDLRAGSLYATERFRELVGMGDEPISDGAELFRRQSFPEDVERCMAEIYRGLNAKERCTIEFRWRMGERSPHKGQVHWFRAHGIGMYDQTGEPARAIGTIADITQERQRERDLREAVERFETLAKLAPVGIFQTGADGSCLYVNDRWCQMAGISERDAAGSGWVKAIHPDDRDETSRKWYDAAQRGVEYYHENRFLRPDGSVVQLVARSFATKDSSGNAVGHLGTCTDVTALKEAEEQLRVALHRQSAAAGRENLLRRELDHRVRNNLASLLGLIRLSEESSLDRRSTIDRMRTAVRTMNDSHEMISRAHGEPVRLDLLLQQLLRGLTARGPDRVSASGDSVRITPERVNALAMTLQELATNSIKHGAFSCPTGRIEVRWHADADQPEHVRLEWRETGAAFPLVPTEGTGLALVRTLVASDLEGTTSFEFTETSMTCVIEFYSSAGAKSAHATHGAAIP